MCKSGETDSRSNTELYEALVAYVRSLAAPIPKPGCPHLVKDEVSGYTVCKACGKAVTDTDTEPSTYEGGYYVERKVREKTPRHLWELGVTVLKRIARALKIKGYSKYKSSNRGELIGLILNHERLVVQITPPPTPPLECLTLKTPVRPSMREVWRFRGEKTMAMDVRGHTAEEFVENDIPKILDRMHASPQLRHHVLASRGETDREVMREAIETQYGYGLGAQREEGLARANQTYECFCEYIVEHASKFAGREGEGLVDELLGIIGDRVEDFGLLNIQQGGVPGRALNPEWQTILTYRIVEDVAECSERARGIKMQTILELGVKK